MFLFVLIALLQTFCYGAYRSLKYEQDYSIRAEHTKDSTPLHQHDKYGFLHYPQKILALNAVWVDKKRDEVVGESLKEMLKTAVIDSVDSVVKRRSLLPLGGKIFIVPGCPMSSLVAIAVGCAPDDIYFFSSKERFLTLKSFMITKSEIKCLKVLYHVELSVTPHPHDQDELDQCKKTMVSIKDFLAQKEASDFDRMFFVHPFSLAKKKMIQHILQRFMPFYDVEDDTSNSKVGYLDYRLKTDYLIRKIIRPSIRTVYKSFINPFRYHLFRL